MNQKQEQKSIENAVEAFKHSIMELGDREHVGYMAFAVTEKMSHGVCFGGRVDLSGMMLAEALAQVVYHTPELTDEYIDITFEVAKAYYHELEKNNGNTGGVLQ